MAALLLAAALIFNIDVIVDRVRGYIDVVAIVLETSGVRIGSPVWVEGMEAGRITGIEFVALGDTGAIALHLRLEDRVRDAVRLGSRARTARHRFIGEPTVRISAGPPDAPPVETGDTLYPLDPVSMEHLVARGREIAPALDSLTAALVALERLVDARRPGLEALVDRLAAATEEAATLRAELDRGAIGEWAGDGTLRRRIEQLEHRLAALSEAARGLQRYGDPELARSVADLAGRAERLSTALADLDRRVEAGRGVIPRMGRDSALAVAVRGVRAQIDSLRAAGLGFALRMLLP